FGGDLASPPRRDEPAGRRRSDRADPTCSPEASDAPAPRAPEELLRLGCPEDDASEPDADEPVIQVERGGAERVVEEAEFHDGYLERDRQPDRPPQQPVGEQMMERAGAIGAGVEAIEELREDERRERHCAGFVDRTRSSEQAAI